MDQKALFGDSSSDESEVVAETNEENLFGQSSSEEEDVANTAEAASDGTGNASDEEGQKWGSESDAEYAGSDHDGEKEEDVAEPADSDNDEAGSDDDEEERNADEQDEEDDNINERVGEERNSDSDASAVSDASEAGEKNPVSDDDQSSDNEAPDQESGKVDNLFGDADDISSSSDEEKQEDEEEEEVKHRRLVVTDDEENEHDNEMEVEEQQEEQEKETLETRIEVEIPKIKTNLGSAIHFVRFPNFISAEPRPFDPAMYEDEIEEDELLDEEGRTRLKLKVENTIRWRKYVDENNIELIESNSRIVRWSDGSISLHLGSEIFDVHQMSLQGDHNHLFIRQGTGLQGQAVFNTKLTFRPHSTKSATHKKMTNRLAMRHNQNQQKVRVLPIAGQDPESRKAALMKEEEEQLKAHVRREAQKRRLRERSHARGLTANYLEERYDDGTTNDDEDEGISVSAIKNKFKTGGSKRDRMNIYSSDSESESEKRLINAKRLSSDDDDDDIFDKGAKRRRDEESRKKTYIVSDEEEDDAEEPQLSS